MEGERAAFARPVGIADFGAVPAYAIDELLASQREILLAQRDHHTREPQEVGVLLGEGPVHPMIVKIDKSVGGRNKDFTFNASSFSFIGHFNSNSISGNLTNGGGNWDGGSDKTVFTQGTNIQTIANPGNSLHTYHQWLQWVNSLDSVH